MSKQAEKEIHQYIDDLCKDGFYGEITLYFQSGDIGNVRRTDRLSKSDIKDRYNAVQPKKKVITVSLQKKAQNNGSLS